MPILAGQFACMLATSLTTSTAEATTCRTCERFAVRVIRVHKIAPLIPPDRSRLLGHIRRANVEDQKEALKWLERKFSVQRPKRKPSR